MTDTTHPRRTRGEAVAAARYQRRLIAAGDDSGAHFMAHVDRIRALKDVLLTRAASSTLAVLIDRHEQLDPKAGAADFTE